MTGKTLLEKVWNDHVVVTSPQGEDLLYVDFNFINEGQSFLAFDQMRVEGRTTKEIAGQLSRSAATVTLHLENAARKLGARNRAQAVARAAHYHVLEGAH